MNPDHLPPDFVLDCLAQNERGDGALFAELHRGRFAYRKGRVRGVWLRREGDGWQVDRFHHVLAAVEQVARTYESAAGRVARDAAVLKFKAIAARACADVFARRRDLTGEADAWEQAAAAARELQQANALIEELHRRASRLRSLRGARRVLFWARHVPNPLLFEVTA